MLTEKVVRRFLPKEAGGGSPDMVRVRAALSHIRDHLAVIGHLAEEAQLARRPAPLVSGSRRSRPSFGGGLPRRCSWHDNEPARPMVPAHQVAAVVPFAVGGYIRGLAPPRQYADLDF